MEHLYNPDRMTEQEIKQTFVARQKQVDELVTMVERQPEGAGVQHVVIIAPRGMGKTTILLMIGFAVRDRGLASRWQTVRFAEESYSITSLADFWLETITLLAEEVNEPSLQTQASALAKEFRKNDELQEATLALLKDWCRQHGKRLVLLVDNFDLILEQINDEQENARLRNLLMNDGTIMLIGGATTFFREARAYDQPLYNFFKIVHLDTLKFEEMQDLLRQRASLDALPNFETTLRANRTRLKVLEYFTGGNPRLVLMLYRIITDSEVVDVRRGLEQLLDQVTPYYKAKLESLPPQQRKILDHIARVSGETHEGLTPTQIAEATRLTPNAVSSQLKRLAEQGYVRSANLRGRSAYYTLSEPLYAIWHQMRFGRNARQKMQWLVNFLKGWYDATELGTESKRLESRFLELLQSGLMREARQVLEHRFYLAEAMDEFSCYSTLSNVIAGYLEMEEKDTLRAEILPALKLENLDVNTLEALVQAECISRTQANQALDRANVPQESRDEAIVAAEMMLGDKFMEVQNFDQALKHYDNALALHPNSLRIHIHRGLVLLSLGRIEEALLVADKVEASAPADGRVNLLKLAMYCAEEHYEEALSSADILIANLPDEYSAWHLHAKVLAELGRYDEAIVSTKRALNIDPNSIETWRLQGEIYNNTKRYEQAVTSLSHALSLDGNARDIRLLRGKIYYKLGEYTQAIEDFNIVLQFEPANITARIEYASALINLGRCLEAIAEYNNILRVIEEQNLPIYVSTPVYIGKMIAYMSIGELAQVSLCWHKAVEVGRELDLWHNAASEFLLIISLKGNLELTYELITKSNMAETFFPLTRALEYLLKHDETLLETLSPEVRNIVEDIVQQIQQAQK